METGKEDMQNLPMFLFLQVNDFPINSNQIWEGEKKRSKGRGMLCHASTFFWKIMKTNKGPDDGFPVSDQKQLLTVTFHKSNI